MSVPFLVRAARDSDYAFVLDTWRRSFEHAPAVAGADPSSYELEMKFVIARLFKTSEVLIACDVEDDDTLLGFASISGPTLNYVYVRKDFRNMGVARTLLAGRKLTGYSFRTLAGERRLKLRERMIFAPRFTIGGS